MYRHKRTSLAFGTYLSFHKETKEGCKQRAFEESSWQDENQD